MSHATRVAAVVVVLAVAALAVPLAAQDPLQVGPDVYKLKLDNERVRVMEVVFVPGGKIGMHSHPDHVAYAVTAGKLRIQAKGGEAQDIDLQPGTALFIPAEAHQAENVGSTELRIVVVELKK